MQNNMPVWKRAARTFIQAAVGVLVTTLASGQSSLTE